MESCREEARPVKMVKEKHFLGSGIIKDCTVDLGRPVDEDDQNMKSPSSKINIRPGKKSGQSPVKSEKVESREEMKSPPLKSKIKSGKKPGQSPVKCEKVKSPSKRNIRPGKKSGQSPVKSEKVESSEEMKSPPSKSKIKSGKKPGQSPVKCEKMKSPSKRNIRPGKKSGQSPVKSEKVECSEEASSSNIQRCLLPYQGSRNLDYSDETSSSSSGTSTSSNSLDWMRSFCIPCTVASRRTGREPPNIFGQSFQHPLPAPHIEGESANYSIFGRQTSAPLINCRRTGQSYLSHHVDTIREMLNVYRRITAAEEREAAAASALAESWTSANRVIQKVNLGTESYERLSQMQSNSIFSIMGSLLTEELNEIGLVFESALRLIQNFQETQSNIRAIPGSENWRQISRSRQGINTSARTALSYIQDLKNYYERATAVTVDWRLIGSDLNIIKLDTDRILEGIQNINLAHELGSRESREQDHEWTSGLLHQQPGSSKSGKRSSPMKPEQEKSWEELLLEPSTSSQGQASTQNPRKETASLFVRRSPSTVSKRHRPTSRGKKSSEFNRLKKKDDQASSQSEENKSEGETSPIKQKRFLDPACSSIQTYRRGESSTSSAGTTSPKKKKGMPKPNIVTKEIPVTPLPAKQDEKKLKTPTKKRKETPKPNVVTKEKPVTPLPSKQDEKKLKTPTKKSEGETSPIKRKCLLEPACSSIQTYKRGESSTSSAGTPSPKKRKETPKLNVVTKEKLVTTLASKQDEKKLKTPTKKPPSAKPTKRKSSIVEQKQGNIESNDGKEHSISPEKESLISSPEKKLKIDDKEGKESDEDDEDFYVSIRMHDEENFIQYYTERTEPLQEVFDDYNEDKSFDVGSTNFLYNGHRLCEAATPNLLKMKNGAKIAVYKLRTDEGMSIDGGSSDIHINIRMNDDPDLTLCNIERNTPLHQVLYDYIRATGFDIKSTIVLYNNLRLQGGETPNLLQMENGAEIVVRKIKLVGEEQKASDERRPLCFYINIRMQDETDLTLYPTERTTALQEVFDKFNEARHFDFESTNFLYKGIKLCGVETPYFLRMKIGAVIVVRKLNIDDEGKTRDEVGPSGFHINIQMQDQTDSTRYDIERTTALRDVTKQFCQDRGFCVRSTNFLYNSYTLIGVETPNFLDMKSGAVIEAQKIKLEDEEGKARDETGSSGFQITLKMQDGTGLYQCYIERTSILRDILITYHLDQNLDFGSTSIRYNNHRLCGVETPNILKMKNDAIIVVHKLIDGRDRGALAGYYVRVQVSDDVDSTLIYKVEDTSLLKEVKEQYSQAMGFYTPFRKFICNDHRLQDYDIPKDLNMKNGSLIKVYYEQIGGEDLE